MVNGDELCAIGKGRLGLHLVDHFGDAFHYVGLLQDRGWREMSLRGVP